GAGRSKSQPNDAGSGEEWLSLAILRNSHYPSAAAERSCNIQVAGLIEGEALRTSQPAIENLHLALMRNAVHRIETRCGGSGNVEIAARSEGQMISRNRRLERGEYEDLAVGADFKDGSAAIAHVQVLFLVERQASGDAHAFHEDRHGAVLRDLIHHAV